MERRAIALLSHFFWTRDWIVGAYELDPLPKDIEAALGLLNNYRDPGERRFKQPNDRAPQPREEDGLQFVQEGATEREEGAVMTQQGAKKPAAAKTNSKGESNCFHCENKGSLLIQADGAMILQVQQPEKTIRSRGLQRNYLYMDTCTTNNQVVDPVYLSKIHTAENPLHLHTNAGTSVSKKQGNLGEHLFWLDTHGIANVILLRSLEARHKVSYDSEHHGGASSCKRTQAK